MPKINRSAKPRFHSIFSSLLLLLLGSITPSGADVILHLRGGDRLTGTIISESATEITLSTKRLGTIKIPSTDILRREVTPAAIESTTEDPLITANTVESKAPPAQPPKTNLVAAPTPPQSITPEKPKVWNIDLQLGLNLRYSTREQQELLAIGKYNYAHNGLRQGFDYNFTYGRTEGIQSANRMSGASKTEYDLAPRIYAFGLGGAGYDDVRKIDLQWEISPGIGYQWIKKPDYVLKTEVGLSYQEQNFSTGRELETYGGRLAGIFTWRIWDKLVADGRAEFFPSFNEFGDYRVRLESTLKYPLRKNLSLNLIVIDLYDTDPAPGVDNNDLQIRSALGVKF